MNVADVIGVVVGFGVMGFMIAGAVWQCFNERRDWNDGICPRCLTPWRSFDVDSQGGRGYNCETRCSSIWVSWLHEHERPGRYTTIQKVGGNNGQHGGDGSVR